MIDLLRDPVWQFILGSAAIIITILIFMLQKGGKSVSFRVISSTHVVNIKSDTKIKPIVMIDNKEIIEPVLSVVDIYNSGSLPILSTDYEKPICLRFEGESEVVAANVISTNPRNIDVDVFSHDKYVYIKPVMLNSKDNIRISVLTSRDFETLNVSGRIIGVQQIRETKNELLIKGNIILLLSNLAAFLLGFYILFADQGSKIFAGLMLGAGLGFAPFVCDKILETLYKNNTIRYSTYRNLYFAIGLFLISATLSIAIIFE